MCRDMFGSISSAVGSDVCGKMGSELIGQLFWS
jgi:hypothetical protein